MRASYQPIREEGLEDSDLGTYICLELGAKLGSFVMDLEKLEVRACSRRLRRTYDRDHVLVNLITWTESLEDISAYPFN